MRSNCPNTPHDSADNGEQGLHARQLCFLEAACEKFGLTNPSELSLDERSTLRSLAEAGRTSPRLIDYVNTARKVLSARPYEDYLTVIRLAAGAQPNTLDPILTLANEFASLSERKCEAHLARDRYLAEHSAFMELERQLSFTPRLRRAVAHEQTLVNFTNAVRSGEYRSTTEVCNQFRHLIALAALRSTNFNSDFQTMRDYREAARQPMGLWEGYQPTSASSAILGNSSAMIDAFEGFGADTFAARRRLKGDSCLYEQFGRDIGNFSILFHKNRDGFPGPGFIVDKINLEQALRAHLQPDENDRFKVYRIIWKAYAEEIRDLAETRVLISRAFIAISGPEHEKYKLPLPQGRPSIHYSLVLYNANHGNTHNNVAHLIPTCLLDEALVDSCVQISPQFILPDPLRDINHARLDIESLRVAARTRHLPLIAVGSPAAAMGHYGFTIEDPTPPAPLHSSIYGTELTVAAHAREDTVHGFLRNDITPPSHHAPIAELTRANLSLWALVRLIRGRWTKGWTGDAETLPVSFSHTQLQQRLRSENLPLHWNSNCVRMLVEAFKWNALRDEKLGFSQRDDPNYFPILALASVQRYAAPVESICLIDTFSGAKGERDALTIIRKGEAPKSYTSLARGFALDDAIFLVKEMLQHASNDELELRFVDRRLVFGN